MEEFGDVCADKTVREVASLVGHRVAVDDWFVPHLSGQWVREDQLSLSVGTLGVNISKEQINTIVPFIAECIAVAKGRRSHPEGPPLPVFAEWGYEHV